MKKLNYPIVCILTVFVFLAFSASCIAQNKKAPSKGKGKTSESKKSGSNDSKKSKDTKTTENKTESNPSTSTPTTNTDNPGSLKNHGPEIQKIIKSETGIIRGYDFGTPLKKIKETEDAQYVADGKDFIIYNVKVNEKEKAEVIYYLDDNDNVKGFGIAFLVNAEVMAQNVEATLIDDFQKYFNDRFGKFKTNDKDDEVWVSQDGTYTIEMGDSSEDSTMVEIEIEIFKKK